MKLQDGVDQVRDLTRKDQVRTGGRIGFAARGTIFGIIGIFAGLLALGHRPPEADQRGAMQALEAHTGGFVLLIVLTVGLVAYAGWQFVEAAFGVAGHGRDRGPRLQAAFGGIVYAVLAVNGVDVLLHRGSKSQAGQQELWTARILAHPGGRWLIGVVGVVVIGVGLFMCWDGARQGFAKYFKLSQLSEAGRRWVLTIGTIGNVGRGVVIGLTGWFVLQAAVSYDVKKARGLDGALRQLGQSSFGRLWVGLAALGLIAFALYCFTETAWRRT